MESMSREANGVSEIVAAGNMGTIHSQVKEQHLQLVPVTGLAWKERADALDWETDVGIHSIAQQRKFISASSCVRLREKKQWYTESKNDVHP